MTYDVIDTFWLTSLTNICIGFVAIKTHGGWKCYAGNGEALDERADVMNIARLGCKVPERIARAVFPEIKGKYKT